MQHENEEEKEARDERGSFHRLKDKFKRMNSRDIINGVYIILSRK